MGRKIYEEATEVTGFDLAVGDVTVDMFGGLYLVVEAAAAVNGIAGYNVGRKDLIDGAATGRTYYVDATSNFALTTV